MSFQSNNGSQGPITLPASPSSPCRHPKDNPDPPSPLLAAAAAADTPHYPNHQPGILIGLASAPLFLPPPGLCALFIFRDASRVNISERDLHQTLEPFFVGSQYASEESLITRLGLAKFSFRGVFARISRFGVPMSGETAKSWHAGRGCSRERNINLLGPASEQS